MHVAPPRSARTSLELSRGRAVGYDSRTASQSGFFEHDRVGGWSARWPRAAASGRVQHRV